ncbi:MAG: hypothetical protein WBD29_14515, partial [Candidatus Competibacter sp.]
MINKLILLIFFQLLAVLPAWAAEIEPQVLLKASDIAVTQSDLQQRLLLLPEAERARILAKPEALKNFLSGIYQTKNMVATAERLKLDEEPLVQAQLVVERQRILAEALREQTRKKIQLPDFAALAREHYAVRRDEFQLPEQFKA